MGVHGWELIIFLVIVLILFGPKNLPKLASALGRSVSELKRGMQGVEEEFKKAADDTPARTEPAPKADAEPGKDSPDPNEEPPKHEES